MDNRLHSLLLDKLAFVTAAIELRTIAISANARCKTPDTASGIVRTVQIKSIFYPEVEVKDIIYLI